MTVEAATGAVGCTVAELTVSFGAVRALADVSVELPAGLRIGVVGPNGAGKTTFLNVLSGFVRADSGSVVADGVELLHLDTRARVELGIVRGFQTVRLLEREVLETNVLLGRERFSDTTSVGQIFGSRRARAETAGHSEALERAIALLGLEGHRGERVMELPFGSRRLVEIARLLVTEPRMLLLDEPMAGLAPDSRRVLAQQLKDLHARTRATYVIVEHDIDIVRDLCQYVVVMAAGSVLAAGPPAEVFARDDVRKAYLGMHS